jgi:heterodisulfide reductase subunit B
MMRYGYFPGCSLNRTAAAYNLSTHAIAQVLGLDLEEVNDWNCCGATEYFSLNKTVGFALVGRNLAMAANQDGLAQLVAPCSACYLNLRKTDHYMQKYPKVEQLTNEALGAGGLHYEPGSLEVRHLIDVVVNDVGYETIAEKVRHPLEGLRLAPYYGCLIVRPQLGDEPLDDPEYPTHLDELLSTIGATVVDFPLKTHCCGGHMTQISAETAYELIRRLLQSAAEYAADAIVTICPMCQLNLDAYQSAVNRHFGTDYKIPILYFTQMVGLAVGIAPRKLGIGKEIIRAAPALRKIGQEAESEPDVVRRRRDDQSLPMPRN